MTSLSTDAGSRSCCTSRSDIQVVGEAENGEEAIARAEELAPDVVLMDVRMPVVDGIEATQAIRDRVPTTKILMLTVSDEDSDLYEAIKAGASGYLLKENRPRRSPSRSGPIMQGESKITPSMASKLINEFSAMSKRVDEKQRMPVPTLTVRELEVLKLVAKGMSNREIADELFISENTVKNHVRNILEKLHLHSRMEAVMYVLREKLLDLRDDD